MSCRARLLTVDADNEDLRAELDAFDPEFFEELEDLKHERHVLAQRCAHVRTANPWSSEPPSHPDAVSTVHA